MDMMKRISYMVIPVLAAAVLALTGCAAKLSPKASFFYLTALETERGEMQRPDLMIGIGPMLLPGYIDRKQLVSQVKSNKMKVDEFNRWAGDLEQNIAAVLAENLSYRLGTDAVLIYPWGQAVDVDYQVVVDIRRFHMAEDQQVHLVAQWRVLVEDGSKLLKIQRQEFTQAVNGDTNNDVVAAQSAVLLQLSRRISESIEGS